jgi:hypothetical protein
LRAENKRLQKKLSSLQRTANETDETEELRIVQREVDRLRRTYDDLHANTTRKINKLEELKEEARGLDLESRKPQNEDTPETRQIRVLENRLDKAMIKFNEAQNIQKTYEQIVKRLKEERVGFENQIKALERTLSAKQTDFEELMLLSGDSQHAKECAFIDLEKARKRYEDGRVRRDRELRERHQVVQLRKQMVDRLKRREKMREQILAKHSADGTTTTAEGDESKLDQSLEMAAQSLEETEIEKRKAKSKIDLFEGAFRRIKESTGVSDVNEIIQKILNQESTTESLKTLTRENQRRIDDMNEERKMRKERLEKLQYEFSSTSSSNYRRKMIDDFESQLTQSNSKMERCFEKHKKLSQTMVEVKAGLSHLLSKLQPFSDDFGLSDLSVENDYLIDILEEIRRAFVSVKKRTSAVKDDENFKIYEKEERKQQKGGRPSSPIRLTSQAHQGKKEEDEQDEDQPSLQDQEYELLKQSRPYNQRIIFGDEEDEEDRVDMHQGTFRTDEDSVYGEDELGRDKLKQTSSEIILSMEGKRAKHKNRRRD